MVLLGMDACSRTRAPVLVAALVAALLCLPASAHAEQPTFTAGPTIQGDAVVGSTLKALATWADTTPPSVPTYVWGRCPDDGSATPTCAIIPGATAPTYVVTNDDLTFRLAVRITLTSGMDTAQASSPPTAVVTPAPTPTPTPTPTPSPPPPPTPPPTITASNSAALPAARPAFLNPFPVVRIRGFFAKRGARITLLSVKGPRKAKVTVRCRGRGCPVKTLTLSSADGRLHRFERFLRAGTLLQIRITRQGRIGAYTSFLIRSRKAPLRTDRCLSVKSAKPIRCSSP
jgi:hypothetical protein